MELTAGGVAAPAAIVRRTPAIAGSRVKYPPNSPRVYALAACGDTLPAMKGRSTALQSGTSSVEDYLASLEDERTVADSRELMTMMRRITGLEPRMWNVGTIGFGVYHYHYGSGREGEGHVLGFYPRKDRLTVYLMDGTARHRDALEQLGKHTSSRVCLYIKRLDDVRRPVLELALRQSYEYITSQDGRMQRVTD